MAVPVGNGLVEITGEKSHDKGFFCIKLCGHITEEMRRVGDTSFDLWHHRFEEAKAGNCAYKSICPNYAKTVAKLGRKPVQLYLNF